jgi:hypothetical protein
VARLRICSLFLQLSGDRFHLIAHPQEPGLRAQLCELKPEHEQIEVPRVFIVGLHLGGKAGDLMREFLPLSRAQRRPRLGCRIPFHQLAGVKPLRDKLRMRLAFGEEMRFPIPQG